MFKTIIPKLFSCVSLIFYGTHIWAQEIQSAELEGYMGSANYYQLTYENDLFRGEDYGNTQNIGFEYSRENLAKRHIFFFAPRLSKSFNYAGFGLEHAVYTPQNLASSEIQDGDYPYAAALCLQAFTVSADTIKNTRLRTQLNIGVIGPLAGGKQMQTSIHTLTGDVIPQGWRHQIANDVLFNYGIAIEKQLFDFTRYFNASLSAQGNVGTLNNILDFGVLAMLGLFQNPFTASKPLKNQFQFYIYNKFSAQAFAYDATLQGGILNSNSTYVVPKEQINAIRFAYKTGLVVRYKNYQLGVHTYFNSAPFKTTSNKRYGGFFLTKAL